MTSAAFKPPVLLPVELKNAKAWVPWRLVQAPGEKKPRKIPYYISGKPRGNDHGSDADRAELATFDRAVAQCIKGGYSGVGLAILPGCGIVALDFDDCVTDGVIADHVQPFIADTYSEISPSGRGVRVFEAGDLKSQKDTKCQRGPFAIEVFGDSGFVTVTGNMTETCRLFELGETLNQVGPATLKMMASRGWPIGGSRMSPLALASDEANLADLDTSQRKGVSLEEIRGELKHIDADCGRDQWVKVLAALHHETQGSDAGLAAGIEWSKTGESFVSEADVRGRWKSFKATSQPITFAYVMKLANEGKKNLKYEARAEHAPLIEAATSDFDLRERICPAIAADERLTTDDRHMLAAALRDKLKGLGTPLPIANCRKLVTPARVERVDGDLPQWALGYVYVTDKDAIFREDSEEWLSKQGFTAKHNRDVGSDTDAYSFLIDRGLIPIVTRARYIPFAESRFTMDGIKCVNEYRPSSVPEAADCMTPAGWDAVEAVKRHLVMMVSSRQRLSETMLSYIAHNVQKPGVKIRWSPLIKGVEGDGKSLLGDLLATVMGKANVNQVNSHELGSAFSDWAEGCCVAVLEEVKLTGANKFDVFNAIKPYITNDTVRVVPKGKKGHDIHNVTNYLGFTNHNDALPISDNDRRWMIIFSPFNSREDLAQVVGDTGPYFTRLIGLIKSQRAELRRWFLDYPIDSHFKPNEPAPHTAERDLMIGMAANDVELIASAIIQNGAPGVASKVLTARHLRDAMLCEMPEQEFRTSSLASVLGRLGWMKFPVQFKWRGRGEWLWFRGHKPTNDQARAALDATFVLGIDQGGDGASEQHFDPFDQVASQRA